MNVMKPCSIDEYKKWLNECLHVEINDRIRNHYDSVTSKAIFEIYKSDYWNRFSELLRVAEQEYYVKTGYNLFYGEIKPELCIKPYESFIDKTYRKNVTNNKNWENEPYKGWILPTNWFSRITDILRGMLVVKYLDGVQFLAGKIKVFCDDNKVENKIYYEAREDGYYASHIYMKQNIEVPSIGFDTEIVTFNIEFHITTQLKEVIRLLTHKYYEEKRGNPRLTDIKWQWDIKDDLFAANYLGHILHYIEGMIIKTRDSAQEK